MMKIRGKVKLNLDFDIEIEISSENLDELSSEEFKDLVCEKIDWDQVLYHVELDDIEDVVATEIREYETA